MPEIDEQINPLEQETPEVEPPPFQPVPKILEVYCPVGRARDQLKGQIRLAMSRTQDAIAFAEASGDSYDAASLRVVYYTLNGVYEGILGVEKIEAKEYSQWEEAHEEWEERSEHFGARFATNGQINLDPTDEDDD